jgi:hypothetical protein
MGKEALVIGAVHHCAVGVVFVFVFVFQFGIASGLSPQPNLGNVV